MPPDAGQRALMVQGIAQMHAGDLNGALGTFNELVEMAPELSEAWNKRATVQWLRGDFPASLKDICETVKREPRHFGAYSGLGMIRAEMGENGRAVAAFELARKYNPHIVGIDAEIARLRNWAARRRRPIRWVAARRRGGPQRQRPARGIATPLLVIAYRCKVNPSRFRE